MSDITEGDRILGAWGETANGPGWGNQLIWVTVLDAQGSVQLRSIQSSEFSDEMLVLHKVSEAASKALSGAISRKYRMETIR